MNQAFNRQGCIQFVTPPPLSPGMYDILISKLPGFISKLPWFISSLAVVYIKAPGVYIKAPGVYIIDPRPFCIYNFAKHFCSHVPWFGSKIPMA